MRLVSVCLMSLLGWPLPAQVGPYPDPGGYPGGRTPGQQTPTPGIPWPKRKNKGGDGKEPSKPERLKTSAGKIRSVEPKTITLEADDGRIVQYRRTDKTKVFEQEKELKIEDLRPGDLVSVDSTEDEDGYFYARDIQIRSRAPKPAAPPESKETGAKVTSAAVSLPPVVGDVGGKEAPKLRRGAHPRQRTIEPRDPLEEAVNAPPPAAPAAEAAAVELPVGGNLVEDPLIAKAREASESFTSRLPNYVCTQFTTRYQSDTRPVDWRPLDVVSADVVYNGGKEEYRNVAINGKKTKKQINEIDGSWSTGEFGTTLVDILARSSNAAFFSRGQTTLGGLSARIYDLRVEKANSHWHIQVAGQWIRPAYKGSLWVEPKTGRVLRIEMQSAALPEEFPLTHVESAIDYEPVRLGTNRYLLPVHAENLACRRFSVACSKSAIDFRNYHQFGSDTNIKFEEAAK